MKRGTSTQPLRWIGVVALLRKQPPGSIVRLPPARVEHPRDGGLAPAMRIPVGQRADYQLEVGEGQYLVVSEFAYGFDAHLEVRPALTDFEKSLRDAPGSAVAGMVAAGALIGLALGRSTQSALAGAAIGGFAALAGVGVANAQSAPEVTAAASQMLAAMSSSFPAAPVAAPATKSKAVEPAKFGSLPAAPWRGR